MRCPSCTFAPPRMLRLKPYQALTWEAILTRQLNMSQKHLRSSFGSSNEPLLSLEGAGDPPPRSLFGCSISGRPQAPRLFMRPQLCGVHGVFLFHPRCMCGHSYSIHLLGVSFTKTQNLASWIGGRQFLSFMKVEKRLFVGTCSYTAEWCMMKPSVNGVFLLFRW